MKLSNLGLAAFAASAVSVAHSFSTAPVFSRHTLTTSSWSSSSSSNSALNIAQWGKSDTEDMATSADNANPEKNIQSYIEEPDGIDPRAKLEGTIMVSGYVNEKERTDQYIFDLINHEDSAFEFKKIVAFVNDAKFAKKRLLSRSSRYSGLLDKLDFSEAASEGALPTVDQLEGINSWLASVESKGDMIEQIKSIAALAKDASSLDNLSVMVTNAAGDVTSAEDRAAAVQALKDTGKEYTLLVVGKIEDRDEGKLPYKFRAFDSEIDEDASLPEDAVFSREEAMRMVTETLQLDSGANKALTFSEVTDSNTTEAKLIKGLREAGYARCQEIDHMLRNGTENYQKALDEFLEKNPNWGDGVYATEAWWEAPAFLKQVEDARNNYSPGGGPLDDDDDEEEVKDERTLEIEKIGTEWAKREYFSQSMAGTVDEEMTEEAFIESVWERALFEGDLKFRQSAGEEADVEAELLDFKAQQERKQQTMLKQAKKELQDVLDEEDLGKVYEEGDLDDQEDDDDE